MQAAVKEKQYEFTLEITAEELNAFVNACDRVLAFGTTIPANASKKYLAAVNEVQKVKNSLLLALNE